MKKGLRRCAKSTYSLVGRPNARPDEEGIKTFALLLSERVHFSPNARPDEEGIKTGPVS